MLAQEVSASTHLFRDGDILVKQEMEFKSPGRRGKNVVWDFSELEFKDRECRYEYVVSNDSLFEMLTPSATYSYKLKQDTLLKIGYDMTNLQMKYVVPQAILRFPFCYGDSLSSYLVGEGTYSHRLGMHTYGYSSVVADATGILLLPDATNYRSAIRIHENAVYGERMSSFVGETSEIKTVGDVKKALESDSVKWVVDTYQWYARGYRYPVFETIETLICCNGDSLRHFTNAYYITKETIESLDADEANERLRDLDLKNFASHGIGQNDNGEDLSQTSDLEGFFYNCFLTDSKQNVRVEFYRKNSSPIDIILSDIHGIVYHHAHKEPGSGIETVDFNVSHLPAAVYILSIAVDGKRFSEKINLS